MTKRPKNLIVSHFSHCVMLPWMLSFPILGPRKVYQIEGFWIINFTECRNFSELHQLIVWLIVSSLARIKAYGHMVWASEQRSINHSKSNVWSGTMRKTVCLIWNGPNLKMPRQYLCSVKQRISYAKRRRTKTALLLNDPSLLFFKKMSSEWTTKFVWEESFFYPRMCCSWESFYGSQLQRISTMSPDDSSYKNNTAMCQDEISLI